MLPNNTILSCIFVTLCTAKRASVSYEGVDPSKWMDSFKDETLLSIPIIPGSHNSATCKPARTASEAAVVQAAWARQQALSIYDQLTIGVRFLDFRVRVHSEWKTPKVWPHAEVVISHSIDTSYTLQWALVEVRKFLIANPTESVILFMRMDWPHRFRNFNESDDVIDSPDRQAILSVLEVSSLRFANIGSKKIEDVMVSELAGKVLLLLPGNGNIQPKGRGVNLPLIDSNKDYAVCDIWNAGKTTSQSQRKITQCMSDAYKNPKRIEGFALDATYLRPPIYTSPKMNQWFLDQMRSSESFKSRMEKGPLGLVMMDFVNAKLVNELLKHNFQPIEATIVARVSEPAEIADMSN